MASVTRFPQVFNFLFYFILILCCLTKLGSANVELDEESWTQILEGEWMVEFYAPWCPACNALAPAWKDLAKRAKSKNLAVKTAAVDVTKSPGLSGRFMVTALPTIFFVKDSVFRQYKGPRDAEAMVDYVDKGKWKQVEAVPSWKAPHSMQMGLVAQFFKLSQVLRSVHTMLMETYGLPTWGSYLIFAVATIFVGALLGLLLVCVIDMLYPPRGRVMVSREEAKQKGDDKKLEDDQELINDDIVDDSEHDSDAEKNSPSETSEDEKEKEEAAGDKPKNDKSEVRKRRPRKEN